MFAKSTTAVFRKVETHGNPPFRPENLWQIPSMQLLGDTNDGPTVTTPSNKMEPKMEVCKDSMNMIVHFNWMILQVATIMVINMAQC